MARIRSVFPGLFTDEAFAPLSDAAQILLIGIWTEADDNGVFEWKPVGMRIRLRPSKDGPIEPMLAELVAANLVLQFDQDGKQYGAIRNFKKYQRPKSPKYIFPLPEKIESYVTGIGHGSAVTAGMDFPRDLTAAERKARQRGHDEASSKSQLSADNIGNGHSSDAREGGTCHGSAVTDVPFEGIGHGSAVTNTEVSRQMEEGGGKRESKPPNPPAGASPPRRKRAKPATTPCPDPTSFEFDALRAKFLEYAKSKSIPEVAAAADFENFIGHHRAKGSTFADWVAAAETWIRRTEQFAQQPRNGGARAGKPQI
jgi:hypothetical protein